jgi:hypothetical protein
MLKISKAQREQIEEAWSNGVTSRLKQHPYPHCKNQSVGLDKMEDLTSENVVEVA